MGVHVSCYIYGCSFELLHLWVFINVSASPRVGRSADRSDSVSVSDSVSLSVSQSANGLASLSVPLSASHCMLRNKSESLPLHKPADFSLLTHSASV